MVVGSFKSLTRFLLTEEKKAIPRLPIIAKYRFEGRYIKWEGAGNWKEILLRGRFFTYGYGESKTCIWHF